MLVRSQTAATKTYSMDIWIRAPSSDFYLFYCKSISCGEVMRQKAKWMQYYG